MASDAAPAAMMIRLILCCSLVASSCSEPKTSPRHAATESSGSDQHAADGAVEVLYPDVIEVAVTRNAEGTYRFAVTLESRYDSPERYADAWRVLTLDGEVLGIRVLTHDHADEQPFTRSLDGVQIPNELGEIRRVKVQGRDQVSGWGGKTVEVDLPR